MTSASPSAHLPPSKPFAVDDLHLHRAITELQCSPTDEQAIAVVRCVDRTHNTYRSQLWQFALDSSAATPLTSGAGNDQLPRWSPDGQRLAFVSDRDGPVQLYLLELGTGETRAVGQLSGAPTDLSWMPDGLSLVVALATPVDPDLHGARSSETPAPRAAGAPEVAWKLPYKADGVGYLLAREIHLFRVNVQSGAAQPLTDGAFDVLAHHVSPDGQRIAYVRTREGRFAHEAEIWVGPAGGTAGHQCLVNTHAHAMQPVWSPSGRYLAFTGSVLAGDAEVRLWLYDITTRQTRQLGDVEVALPSSVHWVGGDDEALVFVRAHRGRHHVARMTLHGELHPMLERDLQVGAFGWTRQHLALAVHHPSQPCELFVCETARCHATWRQASDLNGWWKERTPIRTEAVVFEVPDGEQGGTMRIEGWLMRAEGASGNVPLLNDIHGGPAAYALLDFDSAVYWQVLCSRGWAVLALNAVGSASFGHAFSHALEGHWGARDMPQHLEAIAALQARGVCDERVAVCGKSYGGYLTAWAIGHSAVFKAAVVMAPVGNIETHYGTSDGGYYADPFYMATAPRFDREKARSLSPLRYIERATTPTLFMQGKEDERCPKCQSEELFVSFMRASAAPAELVLYPNEGHGFLGQGAPACRVDAAQRLIDWVTHHTQAEPVNPSADDVEAAPRHKEVQTDDSF